MFAQRFFAVLAVPVLLLVLSIPAWAGIGGDKDNDRRIEKLIQEGRAKNPLVQVQSAKEAGTTYTPTELETGTGRKPAKSRPGAQGAEPGGAAGEEPPAGGAPKGAQ